MKTSSYTVRVFRGTDNLGQVVLHVEVTSPDMIETASEARTLEPGRGNHGIRKNLGLRVPYTLPVRATFEAPVSWQLTPKEELRTVDNDMVERQFVVGSIVDREVVGWLKYPAG